MSLQKKCSANSLHMLDKICHLENIKLDDCYFQNNFNNIKIINRGGFGIVFRGFHAKKEYAVKIVPFLINKHNPEVLLSCRINNKLREVRYLEDLKHPNIITYYYSWIEQGHVIKLNVLRSENLEDFFTGEGDQSLNQSMFNHSIDNTPFEKGDHIILNINIQMEVMDCSLRDYIKCLEHNPKKTLYIIREILNGVQYLHEKEIIHCDLKPENILLRKDATDGSITDVKIADFGLVMERNSGMDTNEFGTPTYMPPEVKTGIVNYKYDIYSLGIIIFELTNKFTTNMERYEMIKKLKEPGIYRCPYGEIVNKMVSTDYLERPDINQVKLYFTNIDKENTLDSL